MTDRRSFAGDDTPDGRARVAFGAGVDNRNHLTRLADGYVRHADNVDIDAHGVGTRRDGYTALATLVNAHSLWSHPMLSFALVADSTQLYRLAPDGTLASIAAGLNGGDVSYALIGQRVRWSNGVQTGQLDLAGNAAPLGVETPLPAFTLAATAAGGLHAGTYGVTLTFANATGEEGGAPATAFVDVAEGGGIQVANVPPALEGEATVARVYVSTANGEELFYAAACVPGSAAGVLVGEGVRGKRLATQFCEPFPPAQCLLAKGGRLFGAAGRQLVWSEPLYYGMWRPTRNTITMPDAITMVAAPDTERLLLYVGTRHKVYLLQGESLETLTLSIVSGAGVIPGSMAMIPHEALRVDRVLAPVPVWAGTDGVPYVGTDFGVLPLSQVFSYPIYDKAAAAFVQQNGLSRYIVSGRGGGTSGLTMRDEAVVTLVTAGP